MCGWSSDVVVETEFRHRDMLERPDDLDFIRIRKRQAFILKVE